MSAIGQPTLGKKDVHSVAIAWSCIGPVDPWPLLPRAEALSLGNPTEVLAKSLCILSTVCNGNTTYCSDLHIVHTEEHAFTCSCLSGGFILGIRDMSVRYFEISYHILDEWPLNIAQPVIVFLGSITLFIEHHSYGDICASERNIKTIVEWLTM